MKVIKKDKEFYHQGLVIDDEMKNVVKFEEKVIHRITANNRIELNKKLNKFIDQKYIQNGNGKKP